MPMLTIKDQMTRRVFGDCTNKQYSNFCWRAKCEGKMPGEVFTELVSLYSRGGVIYDPDKYQSPRKKQDNGAHYG